MSDEQQDVKENNDTALKQDLLSPKQVHDDVGSAADGNGNDTDRHGAIKSKTQTAAEASKAPSPTNAVRQAAQKRKSKSYRSMRSTSFDNFLLSNNSSSSIGDDGHSPSNSRNNHNKPDPLASNSTTTPTTASILNNNNSFQTTVKEEVHTSAPLKPHGELETTPSVVFNNSSSNSNNGNSSFTRSSNFSMDYIDTRTVISMDTTPENLSARDAMATKTTTADQKLHSDLTSSAHSSPLPLAAPPSTEFSQPTAGTARSPPEQQQPRSLPLDATKLAALSFKRHRATSKTTSYRGIVDRERDVGVGVKDDQPGAAAGGGGGGGRGGDDDDDAEDQEEELCPPSFSQFALLSLQPSQLLLLENEKIFADDGPRHLDPFCCSLSEHPIVQFTDFHAPLSATTSATTVVENPQASTLANFCFPQGLKVRYIPTAGKHGAERMGWVGPKGDQCHILVFTKATGETDHGVAVTIRWEVNLKKSDRRQLSDQIYHRRKRRRAARRIERWYFQQKQHQLLKEALRLSGVRATTEELRQELAEEEWKALEKSIRNEAAAVSRRKGANKKKKGANYVQKLNTIMNRKKKNSMSAKSSAVSKDVAEVGKLTRRALKRAGSVASLSIDNTLALSDSGITSVQSPSLTTTPIRKPNQLLKMGASFRTNHRVVRQSLTQLNVNPTPTMIDTGSGYGDGTSTGFFQTPLSLEKTNASQQYPSPIVEEGEHKEVQPPKCDQRSPRERAREAYETMKKNDRLGSFCVVEMCYTLIGCEPDEHALLMGPLKQLINSDRQELLDFRNRKKLTTPRKKTEKAWADVDEERRLELKLTKRRHTIIDAMAQKLRLTVRQALVTFPRSQFEHVFGKQHFFETHIPEIPNSEPIKLPLPLPRVGKQWALARILMDIGPDSLMFCLKLMLLERSLLVVGQKLQEVSACCCALVELIRPFEWASAFMPVLPVKLLDFINCPVPFVAGVAIDDVAVIENDERTLSAMSGGMSLLNLDTNHLHITSEEGVGKMLSLDPYLREQLRLLRSRIVLLANTEPHSALRDFDGFLEGGLTPEESLTLHSTCGVLERHFVQYCADLAINDKAWKQYGMIDANNENQFSFQPDWFLNALEANRAFQEALVHTQLFSGYVHDRRQDQLHVNELLNGELGQYIAGWIYQRWKEKGRR